MYNYVKNTSISMTDIYVQLCKEELYFHDRYICTIMLRRIVFPRLIYMYNYVNKNNISTTHTYVQLCKEEYYFHNRYICTIM